MMRSPAEKLCIKAIRAYYKKEGRHSLPWRKTKDPYRILVSEVMLQQTQVDRVIPKYRSFLKKFPTVRILSDAALGDVLREWQGLGYNRRAAMLHRAAREVVSNHRGRLPRSVEGLKALPGIGPYTASAVCAFAYNAPVVMIETNIRSVVIHHFFSDKTDITDKKVLSIIERILDKKNPRDWYYALMDYGSFLKRTFGNPNSRSAHYVKQSTFKDSDREIRGAIVRVLVERTRSRSALQRMLPFDVQRIDEQLERLVTDGLIAKVHGSYRLP